MVRPVLAVPPILLLALLAGCISDGDEVDPQEGAAAPEPEDPILHGMIADISLEPVQDAIVVITQESLTLYESSTDENGEYETGPLPDGLMRLEVLHECCHPYSKTIRSPDSGPERHDVILEPLPSLDPYALSDEWNGLISCGISLTVSVANSCGDPNHNVSHHFQGHEGLRSIVVGMSWEPAGGNPSEELRLLLETDVSPNHWYTYENVDGPPPLEIHINATGHDAHNLDKIDEEPWDFRFQVRPPEGIAVVYQQSFTVWYELHYWEGAREDASVLPDA